MKRKKKLKLKTYSLSSTYEIAISASEKKKTTVVKIMAKQIRLKVFSWFFFNLISIVACIDSGFEKIYCDGLQFLIVVFVFLFSIFSSSLFSFALFCLVLMTNLLFVLF